MTQTPRRNAVNAQAGPILVPAPEVDFRYWPVVACDQFSSDISYWKRLDAMVGSSPSTLRMILPEAYLNSLTSDQLSKRIQCCDLMKRSYLTQGVLRPLLDATILLERTLPDQRRRYSLLAPIDLEEYNYIDSTGCLIHTSEGTIAQRIGPRKQVLAASILEVPHVLMLFEDANNTVLGPLLAQRNNLEELYYGPLLGNGGTIRSWAVPTASTAWQESELALAHLPSIDNLGFQLVVGDGNHSLAAAKSLWEDLKAQGAPMDHPARHTLVELINIFEPALTFEPIHRLLMGATWPQLATFAERYFQAHSRPHAPLVSIAVLTNHGSATLEVPMTKPLLMENVQDLLDAFVDEFWPDNPNVMEYIHGEDALRTHCDQGDGIGLLLPPLDKHSFFADVAREGVMPRKSFSLGHANEKRYYCEARQIVP